MFQIFPDLSQFWSQFENIFLADLPFFFDSRGKARHKPNGLLSSKPHLLCGFVVSFSSGNEKRKVNQKKSPECFGRSVVAHWYQKSWIPTAVPKMFLFLRFFVEVVGKAVEVIDKAVDMVGEVVEVVGEVV